MKTFTTMTAAAMLIAGMSFANAQNAGGKTETGTPSPSNLNASSIKGDTNQSGSQTKSGAMKKEKGAKPMNAAQKTTVDPSDPNSKPLDSGSATKSGSQSEKSAMQGDKKAKKPMTTGSGDENNKPGEPNAKPPQIKQ